MCPSEVSRSSGDPLGGCLGSLAGPWGFPGSSLGVPRGSLADPWGALGVPGGSLGRCVGEPGWALKNVDF